MSSFSALSHRNSFRTKEIKFGRHFRAHGLLFTASALDTKAVVLEPLVPQSTGISPEARIKERVIEIGPGSFVEVRLHSKQRLVGRITAISDDSFGLQAVKGNTIAEQKVAFGDVKSIKQKNEGPRHALYIWAVVGITLAVLLVLGAIVSAVAARS